MGIRERGENCFQRRKWVVVLILGCISILVNFLSMSISSFQQATKEATKQEQLPAFIGDPVKSLYRLQQYNLTHSERQHVSFVSKKENISSTFSKLRRFTPFLALWAANRLSEEYVYLHIFKNGGTAIAAQTGRDHEPLHKVMSYPWLAVVRDPIDHFLSGWAEVGNEKRKARLRQAKLPLDQPFHPNESVPNHLRMLPYDTRIQQWLKIVQYFALHPKGWRREVHSFPQVNFMLNDEGEIYPNIEIVGDLRDLKSLVKIVTHQNWTTVSSSSIDPKVNNQEVNSNRNATANPFLQHYFPRRIDWISNSTIRKLCDFLAIDYYVLDFELPDACYDMPSGGYTIWNVSTTNSLRKKNNKKKTPGFDFQSHKQQSFPKNKKKESLFPNKQVRSKSTKTN